MILKAGCVNSQSTAVRHEREAEELLRPLFATARSKGNEREAQAPLVPLPTANARAAGVGGGRDDVGEYRRARLQGIPNSATVEQSTNAALVNTTLGLGLAIVCRVFFD